MAVDPSAMIQQIAEYAVWEHPNRPWPERAYTIPVVPVISRHTRLLAVVYHETDNRAEDQDLDHGSGTQRVVFTLTPVSQSRKNVSRMAAHLFDAISFNSELIHRDATDREEIHIPSHLIEYSQILEEDGARITGVLPEVVEIPSMTTPREFGTVRMDSCYAESRQVFYDPSLDVWKGPVVFIADMYEVDLDDPHYLREI